MNFYNLKKIDEHYIVMEKRLNRLVNKSFEKTLLDSPVPNSKIKFSPSGNKSKTLKLIKT